MKLKGKHDKEKALTYDELTWILRVIHETPNVRGADLTTAVGAIQKLQQRQEKKRRRINEAITSS